MVGIVLVAHGKIADAFLDAARQILGGAEAVAAVSVRAPAAEKRVLEEIERARKEVDRGRGVLIVTDMFGGSPCNISLSLLGDRQVEVLTGLNLGMLLKILANRDKVPLAELAQIGRECGVEHIWVGSAILEKGMPGGSNGGRAFSGKTERTK